MTYFPLRQTTCFFIPLVAPCKPLLMIDKAYQNRGYGKEAVSLALEFIKSMPCGEAEYCWLSYEPDNAVARQMYRSFGFEETGEMDGEELIAVLRL